MYETKWINLSDIPGCSGLFYAYGSFGVIDGDHSYTHERKDNIDSYRYETDTVRLTATLTQEENGVVIRHDTFENLSQEPQEIYGLLSRFCLDGNAYEVYTQYNGWQNESDGGWQRLITQVTAATEGIRTCDGAAPVMALHNLYTGKNAVFHLLPCSMWKMTARRFPFSGKEFVVVETGFPGDGLRLTVAPGEVIELPTVLFFSADSKTDLDAYKLHEVYNRRFPRERLPILYNSWLYCFDELNTEKLLHQIDVAAELGFEGFMIDAGWFGNGILWSEAVGDWEVNPDVGLMAISERIREHGMIFGLWFEPERAVPTCKAVATHPDYYINGTFFDFANPEAVDYMLDIIGQYVESYHIGWLKFDFNASLPQDPSGNAFYRYQQGQIAFVKALKERFPHLYLTNCASGGQRMDLVQGQYFDSFWFTDNQGPLQGLEIVKNTLKRMPTGLIERWNVQIFADGFPFYGKKEPVSHMLSCNNATWEAIVRVSDTFTHGFLCGGPMCWSCDLDIPEPHRSEWKAWIAAYRKDRDFYRNAIARILVDTPELSVIEYADPALSRCRLFVFTKTCHARDLILYPYLNAAENYRLNGALHHGRDLIEKGFAVHDLKDNDCQVFELVAEDT